MAEVHRDSAAELAEPDGPFGLPFLRERHQVKHESKEIDRAKKQVDRLPGKEPSSSLPTHLPTYQMLVEVYRGWDDRTKLEEAAQPLARRISRTISKPSRSWPSNTSRRTTRRRLAAGPEGAAAQTARRVASQAGVDHPRRPGPGSCPRQTMGRGAKRVRQSPSNCCLMPKPVYLPGPQGCLRGKGQPGRTERPVSRTGAGQPERPDAALARA